MGSREAANEAFARVKIDQLLKDADWPFSDGSGVRFGRLPDGDGEAGDVLYGCRGGAIEGATKRASIKFRADETQKARYANA